MHKEATASQPVKTEGEEDEKKRIRSARDKTRSKISPAANYRTCQEGQDAEAGGKEAR